MTELRAATSADLDAVLAFWSHAAEDSHRPTDTRSALDRLIARDPDALTIAVHDGAVIGSLISGWDGWRFHLYRLAVDPAERRQGIGRALLAAAEERFAALGATRVDAMVLDANDLGRRIWEAAGYTRQDDWRRWVKAL